MRGKMNADEFRDYILGFIFYKYLSEKVERFADSILEQDGLKFATIDEQTAEGAEIVQAVHEAAVTELGYFLKPSELFHAIAMKGNSQPASPTMALLRCAVIIPIFRTDLSRDCYF